MPLIQWNFQFHNFYSLHLHNNFLFHKLYRKSVLFGLYKCHCRIISGCSILFHRNNDIKDTARKFLIRWHQKKFRSHKEPELSCLKGKTSLELKWNIKWCQTFIMIKVKPSVNSILYRQNNYFWHFFVNLVLRYFH